MNRRISMMRIAIASLFLLFAGCAQMGKTETPPYPIGKVGAVTSLAQFDQWVEEAPDSKGKEIRLAGRIQNIESTDKGYEVLAKWRPYPAGLRIMGDLNAVPSDQGRHFLMYYQGKPNADFRSWRENMFIMEGTVEGTRSAVVDVFGTKKDLLYVRVNCVHVWETGESVMGTDPDSQYNSARERTLCVEKPQ